VSTFPELNVRTYVTTEGKSGVWFFSLDASNPLAVRGARTLFHLPYYDAVMVAESGSGTVQYTSTRTHRGAPSATFAGHYRPIGPVLYTAIDPLEHWLTDRYCHERWPLQPAEADIVCNTMADPLGLRLSLRAPLAPFCPAARCGGVDAGSCEGDVIARWS
jgi:hypothetical protein